MNRNSYCMIMLFSIAISLGTSFKTNCSEVCVAITSLVVVGSVVAFRKTALYKTYSQHDARLKEEKEESHNPLLYAQELSALGQAESQRAQEFQIKYEIERKEYEKKQLQASIPVVIKYSYPLVIQEDYLTKDALPVEYHKT